MSNTLKLGNGKWATGKDTVLSFSDTNNNYKPLPFSFSRASSGTVINKDGLIETVGSGEPRIDFKDNTKGSLLLEPSRTNLVTYSEDFSQGFYAKDSGVSIGTENNISPNGTLNATEINVTNNGRIYANVTTDTYYSSVFIKSESFSHFKLVSSNIDLINETNSNGSIENYGNGWFRIGISYTGNRPFQIQAYPDNSYSSHTTSGNYYIYGVQIEQGSYATSYIPTSGSAVTRVTDLCNNSSINVLDLGNSYTLFLDSPNLPDISNTVLCDIKLSNNTEVFTIRNFSTQLRIYNNLDASYPTTQVQSSTSKWVIRVDGTSFKLFGKEQALTGSLATQRTIGKINFKGIQNTNYLKGFNIYNTALSDAECEALVN